MIAIALVIGLLIGACLGAVGGGGSVLTVPALVYVLGIPVQHATSISLVIVGISSAAGVVSCARAGNVRWGVGIGFCAVGAGASYCGQAASRAVDDRLLLAGFSLVLLAAGAAMLLRAWTKSPRSAPVGLGGPPFERGPRAPVGATRVDVKLIVAALVVGFLTGFFGVGGGFLIVPVLLMTLSYTMPVAVGTSLWIIVLNSGVALVSRAGHDSIDVRVTSLLVAGAIVGTTLARSFADRVSPLALERAFAVFVIVVAFYVGTRSLYAGA